MTRMEHNEMLNLTYFLIECCYGYYVKCKPFISDVEYDRKLKHLESLEAKLDGDEKINPNSPTQKIWGDRESQYPSWLKATL